MSDQQPTQRPLWWRILTFIRQAWNSGAAAGILPSQGQGPGSSGGTSQGKPKAPGR